MTDESQPFELRRPSLREPNVKRGAPVRFTFDGDLVDAYAGESVAAALLAAGYRTLRESPNERAPRGAFCWMGLCQECTMEIDGIRRPACRTECANGIIVRKGTIA